MKNYSISTEELYKKLNSKIPGEALKASVLLAERAGVEPHRIMRSVEDLDRFMLGK